MKKAVVFVVLAMLVICSCAAQSANDAQRIVGTWVSENISNYTRTFVFNANGTGTRTDSDDGKTFNFFWGVSASGELFIDGNFFKFALSPDGKRMFLNYDGNRYQKK